MQMNLASKRRGAHGTSLPCPGRIGHRVARINDSILVVGGTDKTGSFVEQVHRINTQNLRIDTLVMENTISSQGFSLFASQEALFIWGGVRLGQHTNQLYHFDGARFIPLLQKGTLPAPRAYHASATFGGKFLIIFGGNDGLSFLSDWHLLNLKTLEWRQLQAEMAVLPGLNSCMVWANGRGILLVNESFNPTTGTLIPNSFYEFYVRDFNRCLLRVLPLQLPQLSLLDDYVFTQMVVNDTAGNSVMILGGYKVGMPTQLHGVSAVVCLQNQILVERGRFRLRERDQFESIYHRNKLFIIGGIASKDILDNTVEVFQTSDRSNYKRQVCHMCKLYFDEEWFRSSKEVFPSVRVKEEHDYNYHLKMDTRVLAKLSTSIYSQLYALTLIMHALHSFNATLLDVSFHKAKPTLASDSHLQPQEGNQFHQENRLGEAKHFLKIGCVLGQFEEGLIINELLMRSEREECLQQGEMGQDEDWAQLGALKLKLGCFRIGRSCIIAVRVNKQEVCVIYLSCNQLQSGSSAIPVCHYYYNNKTKIYSSLNNSHIVHQNVKSVIPNFSTFQELSDRSLVIVVLCGEEIGSELISLEHNEEVETGETCPASFPKEEHRKEMRLLPFAFLPPSNITILVEHNPISFHNIFDLLKSDARSGILQRIDRYDNLLTTPLFEQIELFHFPSQYWFRRILVYHCNRLVTHFEEPALDVCGAIVLKPILQLDLTGSRPESLVQELKLREIVMDFKTLKRRRPTSD